ncbi:uncharacterized protein LOC135471766 [Liolophura sinensis]|uniref:uncharacterized protein LOC135471766 n=1 Tax=Liolophura sinensis TaxID=3198878 RepID=UPI00315983E9
MTTLPKITPHSTHITRVVKANPYDPYPPRELSFSMDWVSIPSRVNPLAPPPPKRRINSSWETSDQHWHNEKRRNIMQQREHLRYHSAWSKAFYGSPADRESYRRHFREVLKQQMDDKVSNRRQLFCSKVKESERAVEYDRECLQKDAEKYQQRHTYLKQFRDANKSLMESRLTYVKERKLNDNIREREVLRYNPINWSGTLK